jgi:RNA polymerase sigma-32 factor
VKEISKKVSQELTKYEPLQAYLAEIQRYPLLKPEEEFNLAVRYRKKGDLEAARRLATGNLRLVVKIAYGYRRISQNLLDLIQEGNIGLMQAIKRFDPYKGVKLSSYAAWWIRAYMLRYILNNWRVVRIGTTQLQRKLFFHLNKEKARLKAMGFEPSSAKIADKFQIPERVVQEMDQRLSASEISLDASIEAQDKNSSLKGIDLVVSKKVLQDEELFYQKFHKLLHEKLEEFGSRLKKRDYFIFKRRLLADSPLTLQEIGERFGITRERVRQLEKVLLRKIKEFLLKEMGDYLYFE